YYYRYLYNLYSFPTRRSSDLQLISLTSWATDPYPKNEAIDIRHYHFLLEVNDSTNVIYGEASLSIFFKKPISTFSIDLASKDNRSEEHTSELQSLRHLVCRLL